jgi:hypothetical protein
VNLSNRNTQMLIAGLVLLVLAIAGAINAGDDEEASFLAGTAVGRFLACMAIAVFVRWAYLRLRRREGRVLEPGPLFLIAGVICLLSVLGALASEEDADATAEQRRASELVARGVEECAERLPQRVAKVRISDLPPAQLERVRARAARANPGARLTDATRFAAAHWPDGARALITMLPVPPEEMDDSTREQVAEGALMAAAQQGIVGDRIKVGGIPLVHYARGPEHLVVTSLSCHVMYIAAPSQRRGLALARDLLAQVPS